MRSAAAVRRTPGLSAVVLPFVLVTLGCSGDDSGISDPMDDDSPVLEDTGTFTGSEGDLGDGRVYTWAELEDGAPVRLGVTLTEAAVASLPTQSLHMSLDLPREARATTIYDHVLFDWNPQGHDPPGVYDVPHFDFHFYMIADVARDGITAGSASEAVPVSEQYLPDDYVQEGGIVPRMGVHWADTTSAEFDGAFDRTLLFVSYNGEVVSIEPMITLENLEATEDDLVAIKQPSAYQQTGHFPMEYRMQHDSVAGEYHVVLEGFVGR